MFGDQATSTSPARSRRAMVVRAHPLAAFFVITYALSWSYWLAVYGLTGVESELWAMPGVFAPALTAILITHVLHGRPGVRIFFRTCIRWRVPAVWYLVVLVVIPALVVLSYIFLPNGAEGFRRGPVVVGLTYLATLVVIFFVGGGQEEPGWRGFALPRLQQRYGPMSGSVVLGALWGLWHLPLFLLVPNYDHVGYGAAEVATGFLLFVGGFTLGQSLIFTWLFNHTGGSVLVAMLAHASVNTALSFSPKTRPATLVSSLAILAIGLVIAAASKGRLGYRSSPPASAAVTSENGERRY